MTNFETIQTSSLKTLRIMYIIITFKHNLFIYFLFVKLILSKDLQIVPVQHIKLVTSNYVYIINTDVFSFSFFPK